MRPTISDLAMLAADTLTVGSPQSSRSSVALTGTVVNKVTGAPVRNARVWLEPAQKESDTDASGRFQFANVDAGPYLLAIGKMGFEPLDFEYIGDETAR